ncbi:MAG: NIPSNAP family protein [Fidelibacterota bacterium]|nr:MAG: NIPSNAP family protein [Candidatus Neomarinimicrobiota bacterium]
MKRRDFIAATALAGAAPLKTITAATTRKGKSDPEYYELRQYYLLSRVARKRLDDFLRDAALPALNRNGIEPVGVFNVMYGPNRPTVYVLLPHKSLESFSSIDERLAADARYQRAGASFLDAPLSDPAYVRIDSSLMVAFDQMPRLVLPAATAKKKPRIFELRTYESHSKKKADNKIEMFNAGGEIALFLEIGLQPVFFGETLIGSNLPNLTYMVVFDDMDQRDETWQKFSSSAEWKELSANPVYADTVSNINVSFLRPASYSQI